MPSQSAQRPSKRNPEKVDLDKFTNGGDGRGLGRKELLSYSETNEIIKDIDGLIKTVQDGVLSGVNAGKPESKSSVPSWTMVVMVVILFICILFGFFAAVNYKNYFTKEFQSMAITFIFQIPTAIISYFAGKKTKGD
jgi:hypothetical protein